MRLPSPDFESGASANSATSAVLALLYYKSIQIQVKACKRALFRPKKTPASLVLLLVAPFARTASDANRPFGVRDGKP